MVERRMTNQSDSETGLLDLLASWQSEADEIPESDDPPAEPVKLQQPETQTP